MKINSLSIKNFRCFNEYQITLASRMTILIGKNGAGKTSLIEALKKGMSFMFGSSPLYANNFKDASGCSVRTFGWWDVRFDQEQRIRAFPVQIDIDGIFSGQPIAWTLQKKTDKGNLQPTLYQSALNTVLSYYNNNDSSAVLPVLAFFSDSYPHILSNVGEKAGTMAQLDALPRSFGYYGWDADTNCAELWQRRYIKMYNTQRDMKDALEEIVAQEQKLDLDKDLPKAQQLQQQSVAAHAEELRCKRELDFVNQRIYAFTEPLDSRFGFINSDFSVSRIYVNRPDRTSFSIALSFADGTARYFETLPQGYQRLMSIVFDIASRSYALNEDKEPTGLVFIDEVELHLHPALQQEVLRRFSKAFPSIQFVASTHSPSVISNIVADGLENKIIRLENIAGEYTNSEVENICGIDYTNSLMDIMGARYRSSTIDAMIDSYIILKHNKRESDAERIKQQLFEIVGEGNKHVEKEIQLKLEQNR